MFACFSMYNFSRFFSHSAKYFAQHVRQQPKKVIFGVLEFDHFIITNIPSLLVTKIPQHDPGHSACLLPIGSLKPSIYCLRIRHKIFYQNRMSLWMWHHQNRRPIGSLWVSLHHLRFAQISCYRRRIPLWMQKIQKCCPIFRQRTYIHYI